MIPRLLYRCAWLMAALMFTGQVAAADEAVTLLYKMTNDDKLIYRTVSKVSQTQTVNNMEITSEFTNTDVAVRTLEKIDEQENFVIRTENKLLKVEMKNNLFGNYTYDSTSSDRDTGSQIGQAITPMYDRLNGAVLTFRHTPQGKVTEAKGLTELLGDVLKENPVAAQFAGGASDEAATQQISETFIRLNADPVKPGDTWESDYSLNLPRLGQIDGKRKYTFEGFDEVAGRKTAKISVSHEFSVDVDLDLNGVKGTGTFSTDSSSGTIQFDPDKGQILLLKSEYTLSGDVTVNANNQTITVGTSQKQTVTHELLDELPE